MELVIEYLCPWIVRKCAKKLYVLRHSCCLDEQESFENTSVCIKKLTWWMRILHSSHPVTYFDNFLMRSGLPIIFLTKNRWAIGFCTCINTESCTKNLNVIASEVVHLNYNNSCSTNSTVLAKVVANVYHQPANQCILWNLQV